MNRRAHPNFAERSDRRSFTLTELLVAIGIIAVIAAVTVVGIRQVSAEARLSSAVNSVTAALDSGRAMALKNNKPVLVVFRPRLTDNNNEQFVEAVLAEWTGESYPFAVGSTALVVDRFAPIPDIRPRDLPKGIKVAGPEYRTNADDTWLTQPHLPAIDQDTPTTAGNEAHGFLLGVMYDSDGTVVTGNSQSDSDYVFVDFNDDFEEALTGNDIDGDGDDGQQHHDSMAAPYNYDGNTPTNSAALTALFRLRWENDEPYVTSMPFLAVFDSREARDFYDTTGWNSFNARQSDLNDFINENADRIHFNRYTGVVLR